MSDFANLRAGGEALITAIAALGTDVQLLPIMPNGVPVAIPIAQTLSLAITPLEVERTDDGVQVMNVPDVVKSTVVVIDDGVETGTAAMAAAMALKPHVIDRLVLAVPVCPREASAQLALVYDQMIAAKQPFARRALQWHYADFNTIDDVIARQMLAEHDEAGSR